MPPPIPLSLHFHPKYEWQICLGCKCNEKRHLRGLGTDCREVNPVWIIISYQIESSKYKHVLYSRCKTWHKWKSSHEGLVPLSLKGPSVLLRGAFTFLMLFFFFCSLEWVIAFESRSHETGRRKHSQSRFRMKLEEWRDKSCLKDSQSATLHLCLRSQISCEEAGTCTTMELLVCINSDEWKKKRYMWWKEHQSYSARFELTQICSTHCDIVVVVIKTVHGSNA